MARILTLGESLLRLSTRSGQRLNNATTLDIVYGGAESNVAVNLAQLGNQVSYATKLPDNALSQALTQQLHRFAVDTSKILYGGERLGCYYLEVGSGLRASSVVYDRVHSAIATMTMLEWDLDALFEDVVLFHISGITLALSPLWHKLGMTLMREAKRRQIAVSFDMNYRAKLWSYEEAIPVYKEVLPFVDYLSAGRLDAIHLLEIEDKANYLERIAQRYPQLIYIYGTHRETQTPNRYRLQGYIWDVAQREYVQSRLYMIDEVIDRVGTGDSYAAGILDGIVHGKKTQDIVEFATASAVLKHSVFGDVNRFNRSEIENFMHGTSNIVR